MEKVVPSRPTTHAKTMEMPLHENEILVWLLGTVVLSFLHIYREQINHLPSPRLLFAAYVSVWTSWTSTNLEHLFFYEFFNVLEHTGYALNGILLLAWCSLAFSSKHEEQTDDKRA
jgi:hypothetical protein